MLAPLSGHSCSRGPAPRALRSRVHRAGPCGKALAAALAGLVAAGLGFQLVPSDTLPRGVRHVTVTLSSAP